MVTQVIITHSDGQLFTNDRGIPLADYCTQLKYKAEEGVSNDAGEITLIFDDVATANSFYLNVGFHIYVRYGITGVLTDYLDLVIDEVEKQVSKTGITFTLTVIPLVEYEDKNYPISSGNAWDKVREMLGEVRLKFELPFQFKYYLELHRDIQEEKKKKNALSNEQFLKSYSYSLQSITAGSAYGTVAEDQVQKRELLEKYFDSKFDPVALSSSVLKQLEEAVSRYEAAIVDAHGNTITIKERDLTKPPEISLNASGLLSDKNPDNIISYKFSASDKAVKTESMIQATVDYETKDLGLTKVTSLPTDFVEIPIFHVGRSKNIDGEDPSLVFKVITDGSTFYSVSNDTGFVKKMDKETVDAVRQQMNSYWDYVVNQPLVQDKDSEYGTSFQKLNLLKFRDQESLLNQEQREIYERVIVSSQKLLIGDELYPNQMLLTGVDKGPGMYNLIEPGYLDREVTYNRYWEDVTTGYDGEYPVINDITPLTAFMVTHGVSSVSLYPEVAKHILAQRVERLMDTSFPVSQDEIVSLMLKHTTDEALYKRKLTITIEGRPGIQVGSILYFKSALEGESGRFYIIAVEDTVTTKGFLTKIEALKIPAKLKSLREQYKAQVEGAWETLIDEAVEHIKKEADELIDNTIMRNETQDLNKVPYIEVEFIRGSKDIDKINGPAIEAVRTIPQRQWVGGN